MSSHSRASCLPCTRPGSGSATCEPVSINRAAMAYLFFVAGRARRPPTTGCLPGPILCTGTPVILLAATRASVCGSLLFVCTTLGGCLWFTCAAVDGFFMSASLLSFGRTGAGPGRGYSHSHDHCH